MNSFFTGSTLRDYIRAIFKRKFVIIITFITVMISVIIGLELKTPIYQAQVKMLVSGEKQVDSPYYSGMRDYQHSTQSMIVNTNPVIERAVKALKLDERPLDYEKNFCSPLKAWVIDLENRISQPEYISPEEEQARRFRRAVEGLKRSIKVDSIKGTDLFIINVSDYSPEAAANMANVVSRSFVIFDLEQQLAELRMKYGEKQQVVTQLKDNIDGMTKNLTGRTLSSIDAIGPASVKIIEQSQVPLKPTGTSNQTTLLLALFMGPFLGVMLIFGFEYIDHTFKTPQDAETFLNLPLLGSIPKKGFKDKTLVKDSKQITAFTHSYQNLSDQTYLLMKDKNLKSILITAPSPSEGSTTIIANLSNYLSNKAGHKVMVIDANLKAPAMHKVFNIPDSPGLANVLEGKISLEKASRDLGPNLTVLPAGNTTLNPTPLLDSTSMFNIIKASKEKYEFIFVDYANLRSFKDACVLSPYLDGIVLVVNEGKTRRHVIETLIAPLKQKKSNLIGFIFNNRTFAIPKLLYDRL